MSIPQKHLSTNYLYEEPETRVTAPIWALSFSDLMLLLTTFFILWCSLGVSGDQKKFKAMQTVLKKRFAAADPSAVASGGKKSTPSTGSNARGNVAGRFSLAATPAYDLEIRNTPDSAAAGLVFSQKQENLIADHKETLQAWAETWDHSSKPVEIRGWVTERAKATMPAEEAWNRAYSRCWKARNYLVQIGVRPEILRLVVADRSVPTLQKR